MPSLEALEIMVPVLDLSFFERLGRPPPADSTTTSETLRVLSTEGLLHNRTALAETIEARSVQESYHP